MRVATLGSGSEGNAHYLECDGTAILVDAGFGIRETARRLKRIGRKIEELDAILLTHEHGDHIRGALRIARKYQIPVYATAGTHAGAFLPANELPVRTFLNGKSFRVGDLLIHPEKTSHDAFDPSCFVVESRAGVRAGVATDLGWIGERVKAHLRSCHALLFESNYDTDMLRTGPYPWFLKRRILSRVGHLSNDDALGALYDLVGPELSTLVLIHLSKTNNLPSIVQTEARQVLTEIGARIDTHISSQSEPTPLLTIGPGTPRDPMAHAHPRVQLQLFPI